MTEDERKCPRCAEIIKKDAVVCRFCGLGKPEPSDHPVNVIAGPKRNSFESCMGCFGIGFVVLLAISQCHLPEASSNLPLEPLDPVATPTPLAPSAFSYQRWSD